MSIVEDGEEGDDDLGGAPEVVLDVGSGDDGGEEGEEGEEEDPDEYIHVDEKYYYLEYIIRGLGITHAIVSFCMCIAYYNLKVPLALFKREKEVARRLEFDGLYLAEQPEDDDMKGYWDKLVISAKSFPALYWDKFVKKRVRQKYAEQFEFDAISNILGMEKSALAQDSNEHTGIVGLITSIDWRYQVWKAGITLTDNVKIIPWCEKWIEFVICFLFTAILVPIVVLHLLCPGQLQLLLLCCPSFGRGRGRGSLEDHPGGHHTQWQKSCFDSHAAHHRGLHLHGDRVQLFPKILRLGRGRGSGSKVPRHVHGNYGNANRS